MDEKKKLRVKPVRDVVHTRYSDLVGIKGQKCYYVNQLSGKITFKDKSVLIRTPATTIMAAKQFVEERRESRRTGQSLARVRRKLQGETNPMIAPIWEELMAQKAVECTESTMWTYRTSWKHGIGPFWGTKHASDVTPENIQAFKTWYLAEHPKRYSEVTTVHLATLFRFMVKARCLDEMPDLRDLKNLEEIVVKNSRREKVGRVLTVAEEHHLLEAIELLDRPSKTDAGTTLRHKRMLKHRTKLAVMIGLKAGMRKMEILSLPWDRVNFDEAVLKVWSSKNHGWRDVPLVPEIVELLRAQKEFSGAAKWVFPRPTMPSIHIASGVLDKKWVDVKALSRIPGRLRFHDLRHTFATRTAEAGWPPKLACDILDMSLEQYQYTYCNPSLDSKSEWMTKTFGGGAR